MELIQALYTLRDAVLGAALPLAVIAGLVLLTVTLLVYSGENTGGYSSR